MVFSIFLGTATNIYPEYETVNETSFLSTNCDVVGTNQCCECLSPIDFTSTFDIFFYPSVITCWHGGNVTCLLESRLDTSLYWQADCVLYSRVFFSNNSDTSIVIFWFITLTTCSLLEVVVWFLFSLDSIIFM